MLYSSQLSGMIKIVLAIAFILGSLSRNQLGFDLSKMWAFGKGGPQDKIFARNFL